MDSDLGLATKTAKAVNTLIMDKFTMVHAIKKEIL